ncbi:MAG: four helix bundle protein [Bacteroidota bacterium]
MTFSTHNFEKLKIWKNAFEIADQVYDQVGSWPKHELYNLSQQTTRSASSVPANIAEGSAKSSDKDFKRFLEIALGSCYELQTHLMLAQRRQFGNQKALTDLLDQIDEEQKMLIGFINRLRTKITS